MPIWKTFVSTLDNRKPLAPLHPTSTWDKQLSEQLIASSSQELFDTAQVDDMVVLHTKAGLLLWNDDLTASHDIVQNLHSPEGSYWHAIMHRREGDYSNAKYWFAKVGQHPIQDTLYQQAVRLWPECQSWSKWSSDRFVDHVQKAVQNGEETVPDGEALRRLQIVEFSLLLRYLL